MKNILLAVALLAVTSTSSFAQAKVRFHGLVPSSKTDFSAKVVRFNNFITGGNLAAADKTYDSLVNMMVNQVQYSAYFQNDDSVAHNPSLAAIGQSQFKNKSILQSKIRSYHSNLIANRIPMVTELNNFVAIMD